LQRGRKPAATGFGCANPEETKMFEDLTRRFHAWHMRNVTRHKLSMLDDRLLTDMGIRRDRIGDFVAGLGRKGGCK